MFLLYLGFGSLSVTEKRLFEILIVFKSTFSGGMVVFMVLSSGGKYFLILLSICGRLSIYSQFGLRLGEVLRRILMTLERS